MEEKEGKKEAWVAQKIGKEAVDLSGMRLCHWSQMGVQVNVIATV